MSPSAFRQRRLAMNLTQNHLATALGVSRSNIARYERGDIPISKAMSRLMEFISNLHGKETKT